MPANTTPIWGLTSNIGGLGNAAITAANTAQDGTGTVTTCFTAGANGSWLSGVRLRASGGSGNNNVATVARFFLNNGSTNTSAANNQLIGEYTLPATTGSATAASPDLFWGYNRPIPAGWKILVVLGTAVASGWFAIGEGKDY
jgi:hypothetical protein